MNFAYKVVSPDKQYLQYHIVCLTILNLRTTSSLYVF